MCLKLKSDKNAELESSNARYLSTQQSAWQLVALVFAFRVRKILFQVRLLQLKKSLKLKSSQKKSRSSRRRPQILIFQKYGIIINMYLEYEARQAVFLVIRTILHPLE